MTHELYSGSESDEQAQAAFLMLLFNQARSRRTTFELQWEEAAAICWPEYRNSFAFGHVRPAGAKYTEFQLDTKGSIASHRFMAICDALLTPFNMMWSYIKAGGPEGDRLMRDPTIKRYFRKLTLTLWEERYRPESNFFGQNQCGWQTLGVFGGRGLFIDELDRQPDMSAPRGLRYINTSPGEMYVLRNHQGRVDGYIRHFRWTARQAHQRWPDKIPPAIRAAYELNSQELYDFLQFVLPRGDYDPTRVFSPQGKPFASVYLSIVGMQIMEQGGFRTFPLPYSDYMLAPEEEYGRGPAQMVLPELKTLNAEKGFFLKQGHLAGDPAYLLPGDDTLDFKAHAGAYNYGGMTEDGRRLVDVIPTGNIQVTQEMMAESGKAVDDAFLVSLFPLLFDDKGGQKSAREVIEAANDRGIFLAPTLGRQFGFIGNVIDREIDLLAFMRKLPKMPPALKEARGEYKTVYCSPLARSLEGQSIAGYMRTVEIGQQIVNVTGDQSVMDVFDFEEALPDIAEEQFSPPRWMATPQKIAAKRAARAKAQERELQTKELPGQAAIMKAQAITAKAQTGGNTGGTLSGTPQGGMPMMPGQSTPGGRAFGQPGQQ